MHLSSLDTPAEATARLRHAILLQLAATSPVSLPLRTLLQGLTLAGFPNDAAPVQRELAYLHDKGFVRPEAKAIAQGLARWTLSAAGRDYLEREGLA